MAAAALLLLLLLGDAPEAGGAKHWMVLCKDNSGEFWVDTTSGRFTSEPARVKRIQEAKARAAAGRPALLVPIPVRLPFATEESTVGNLTVRTEREGNRRRLTLRTGKERPVYLTDSRHDSFAPTLSPDGEQIAYLRWDLKSRSGEGRKLDLVVHAIATGQIRVFVKRSLLGGPVWSPDGNWLAVASGANISVYGVARGKRKKRWKTKQFDKRFTKHGATSLLWSPNSTHIAARFTFLGKRKRSEPRVANQEYGDNKLVVIEFATGAAKIHALPVLSFEGPIRGELRAPVPKK